jgi:hypothetical protein
MTTKRTYSTTTGRILDLAGVGADESEFLAAVREQYAATPEWSEFAAWWVAEFQRRDLPQGSPAYRVCQDLEARLGIA